MNAELGRRSLFKGLLAVSVLRFLPAAPVVAPTSPLVENALNPFAAGNTETLTKMVLALMEDEHRVEAIGAIRAVPSFGIDLLDNIVPGESVANFLTRHFGEGKWSRWAYSVDEVRDAFASLERRDALRIEAARHFMGHVPGQPEHLETESAFDGPTVAA